jgi:hypothetical protein
VGERVGRVLEDALEGGLGAEDGLREGGVVDDEGGGEDVVADGEVGKDAGVFGDEGLFLEGEDLRSKVS